MILYRNLRYAPIKADSSQKPKDADCRTFLKIGAGVVAGAAIATVVEVPHYSSSSSSVSSLKSQLTSTPAQLNPAQDQVTSLNNQLSSTAVQLTSANSQLTGMSIQLSSTQQALTSANGQISSLSSAVTRCLCDLERIDDVYVQEELGAVLLSRAQGDDHDPSLVYG